MQVTITDKEYQDLMRIKREHELLCPLLKTAPDKDNKIIEMIFSEIERFNELARKEIGKIFFISKFKKYVYSSQLLLNLLDSILTREIAKRKELLK